MDAAIIEAHAMQLTETDRAILADRLIHSIIPVREPILSAWNKEIDSRMAAYRSGKIEAIDGRVAMDELLKRFVK